MEKADYCNIFAATRECIIQMLSKHRTGFESFFDPFFDPLCGTGEALSSMNDSLRISKLFVNDLCSNALTVAKKKCPTAIFSCQDVNQFTQDQFRGKYDLIYISIPGSFVDLQKLLKNSYSWLAKEGFLVYITSTADTFDELYTEKFRHFKWLANIKRNTSQLPFSEDSSCQLVSSFGFSLVEQKLLQIKIPLDSPDNIRNFAINSTWA